MEQLTHSTFNLHTPEGMQAFQHNKRILDSFNAKTSSNLLGIIQASGDTLSRVRGGAWLKQWYIDADPSLNPLVSTLATTFNTAKSICEMSIQTFQNTRSDEDLLKANESISELKKIIDELEVISDGYQYRYGTDPDRTVEPLISRLFRRNPETTYPAQAAALDTLNSLLTNYRQEVATLSKDWDQELIQAIHKAPSLFSELLIRDLSLKNNKPFILAVLTTPQLTSQDKLRIFTLCDVHLQKDQDVLTAANFAKPAA